MKAFLFALIAAAVITVGANQILINSGFSSANMGSSENVRLPHD